MIFNDQGRLCIHTFQFYQIREWFDGFIQGFIDSFSLIVGRSLFVRIIAIASVATVSASAFVFIAVDSCTETNAILFQTSAEQRKDDGQT
jgi:hypothetical protein